MVDDAIASAIENITRHTRKWHETDGGLPSKVRKEIGFTVLSMSASLIAVFIPILMMSGVVGPPVPRIRDEFFPQPQSLCP